MADDFPRHAGDADNGLLLMAGIISSISASSARRDFLRPDERQERVGLRQMHPDAHSRVRQNLRAVRRFSIYFPNFFLMTGQISLLSDPSFQIPMPASLYFLTKSSLGAML